MRTVIRTKSSVVEGVSVIGRMIIVVVIIVIGERAGSADL